MPELLELVEQLKARDASIERLYNGDGRSVRSMRRHPRYQAQLAEATKFVADIMSGRLPMHYFTEAMTTSDFPLLFGDVLDRQLLASYREAPATFRMYTRIATVPDFRNVSRYAIDGADQILTVVEEKAEYPESSVDEQRDQYSVEKRGRRLPISWESIVNDDLDALRDMPARLGRAARRSEERFATTLFATANGPSTAIYTTARGNLRVSTGVDTLTIANLQAAFEDMAEQTDPGGEPILTDQMHLVIPPTMEVRALNLLNGLTLENTATVAGGGTNQTVIGQNWMRNRLQLHVNRYLPVITNGTRGRHSWYIFSSPMESRPTIEMGFLRGHQEPEIWIKRANAMRVGGGEVSPLEGDFDTDSIQYRVRHVFGGAALVNTGGFRNSFAFRSGTTA